MLVKTFVAKDMPTAMLLVKAELGPNAMILSTGLQKPKGWFAFLRKPKYEIVAGLDTDPRESSKPRSRGQETSLTTREEFQASILAPLAREVKSLKDELLDLRRRDASRQAVEQGRSETPFSPPPFHGASTQSMPLEPPVVPEAATLPAKEATIEAGAEQGEGGSVFLDWLIRSGMTPEQAARFLDTLQLPADDGRPGDLLRSSIARQVKCGSTLKKKRGGPRIIALVGPTGVGKTTTIAKLAAIAFKQHSSVAMITIDTFRIGAVEQLKTYCKIMNAPLEVAADGKTLAAAVGKFAGYDYIFIDTSGRSPMDAAHLAEMKLILSAVKDVEVHLCLAATSRTSQALETIRRFTEFGVDKLLFTKLDESESYGGMLAAHLESKMVLSFFTVGQRVPEDIECASARKLARLVVGEG